MAVWRSNGRRKAARHWLANMVMLVMTLACVPSEKPPKASSETPPQTPSETLSEAPAAPQAKADSDPPEATPDTVRVTSASPIEAKLAVLELGREGSEQVVEAALVGDFDDVLAKLDGLCRENRAQIADMGVLAVQQVRQGGRAMGYLEWFRDVESLLVAANAPADGSTDCRIIFASTLTVLER